MFHQNLLVGLAKDQTTANLTIYTRIFWKFLERTRDQAHSQDCTRHRGSYVRVLRTSLILRAVLWRDRAHFPPQLLPRTLSQLKIRSKSGIGSGGLGRSPQRGPEAKLLVGKLSIWCDKQTANCSSNVAHKHSMKMNVIYAAKCTLE